MISGGFDTRGVRPYPNDPYNHKRTTREKKPLYTAQHFAPPLVLVWKITRLLVSLLPTNRQISFDRIHTFFCRGSKYYEPQLVSYHIDLIEVSYLVT
jgi:hypothetical protein